MRVRTVLSGVVVAAGLLSISGCVEGETELVLNADGQGSVRNVVRLGELASVMMRMGELEGGRPGSEAEISLCEMLERAEQGLGLDVSYEVPEGEDRHRACIRVVSVEDWSQGLEDLLGGDEEGVTIEEGQRALLVRHDGGLMYEALLGSNGDGGALCRHAEVEDVELCRELMEANELSAGEMAEIWPLMVSELNLGQTPMRFWFSVEGDGVVPLEGLTKERYERAGGGAGIRYVHEQICDMQEDIVCADMIRRTKWSFRVELPD